MLSASLGDPGARQKQLRARLHKMLQPGGTATVEARPGEARIACVLRAAFRGLARPRQNRKTPLACKITRPRGLELI